MNIVNLADIEALARQVLSDSAWDYVAGGAEDEYTIAENIQAYKRIKLRPKMLVDVNTRDLATEVLGQHIALPVLLAPTSPLRLFHRDAEKAAACAAAQMGTIAICSTDSHYSIEEVKAASSGVLWFQLYCYENRSVITRLVRRAEDAGCTALVVTVDADYPARRERLIRSSFRLPEDIQLGNLMGIGLSETLWEGTADVNRFLGNLEAHQLTWKDLAWLRSITDLPLLLKGIMTSEDAIKAVEHGIDGIIVSNHGGRQVDTAQASIEALAEIAPCVQGRIQILVDGGIRRGTDILKALALGAKAVLIGRPYIWGLATEGTAGIVRVLKMLYAEIDCAMVQLGCPTIQSIDRSLISMHYRERTSS